MKGTCPAPAQWVRLHARRRRVGAALAGCAASDLHSQLGCLWAQLADRLPRSAGLERSGGRSMGGSMRQKSALPSPQASFLAAAGSRGASTSATMVRRAGGALRAGEGRSSSGRRRLQGAAAGQGRRQQRPGPPSRRHASPGSDGDAARGLGPRLRPPGGGAWRPGWLAAARGPQAAASRHPSPSAAVARVGRAWRPPRPLLRLRIELAMPCPARRCWRATSTCCTPRRSWRSGSTS